MLLIKKFLCGAQWKTTTSIAEENKFLVAKWNGFIFKV